MDQDRIKEIIDHSGIVYRLGVRQQQWHQSRFFGVGTQHSLNLGYSLPRGVFVADFVFKGFTMGLNKSKCMEFCSLYGGELHDDKTIFSRFYIPFRAEARLVQIIQGYWAIQM